MRNLAASVLNMQNKRKLDEPFAHRPGPPNGVKKARHYTSADAELAKILDHLASDSSDVRLAAAADLVKSLNDAAPGNVQASNLSEEAVSHVQNVMRRLIRGLCSSRKSARQGFFIALVEVLRLHASSTRLSEECLEMAQTLTKAEGGASGQEKRDYLIGRMSAYSALIHSEIFSQDPHGQDPHFPLLINAMSDLCQQSRWLQEEYGLILCQAVNALASKPGSPEYFQIMVQNLVSHGLARTPEGIALWLEIRSASPDTKLPKDVWHHKDPLSHSELLAVAKALKQGQDSGTNNGQTKPNSSGTRQASPNFAWNVVFRHVLAKEHRKSPDSEEDQQKSLLKRFWFQTVDDGLFAPTASVERKALGFQVFANFLEICAPRDLRIAFSPNLMRCLINQSAKSERFLHATAKGLLNALISKAESSPEFAPAILDGLLSGYGSLNFDKATGSKTVQSILAGLDKSPGDQLSYDVAKMLVKKLYNANYSDSNGGVSNVQSIMDLLMSLFRGISAETAERLETEKQPWPLTILSELCIICYCSDGTLATTETQLERVKDILKQRLSSIIAHVISIKSEFAQAWPIAAVSGLHRSHKEQLILRKEASEEVQKTIDDAAKCLSKLVKPAKSNGKSARAFGLLIAMTLLQAHNGEMDAIPILGDLMDSYTSFEESQGASEEGSSIIIEIILSFVSKPSVLYRRLAEQVFGTFAADLSADALDSMLDVLEQRDDASGQKALFEQQGGTEDVEMEDAESEHSLEADDSDVEEISEPVTSQEDEDEDDEDDDNASSASSGSSASADSELTRFNNALASTLGTSKSADDDAASTSSDSSMDDEQMLALEPHLTEIFKQRAAGRTQPDARGKKTAAKRDHAQAKQTMLNFKNRVLDLLAIWLKQQPQAPLTLHVILPLLALMRATKTPQIADKAAATLRAFFDAAKGRRLEVLVAANGALIAGDDDDAPETHTDLLELFEAVHDEALRFASKAHAAACSRASLFVARCLLADAPAQVGVADGEDGDGEDEDQEDDELTGVEAHVALRRAIIDRYAETMKERLESGSGLPQSFFNDFVTWDYTMGK